MQRMLDAGIATRRGVDERPSRGVVSGGLVARGQRRSAAGEDAQDTAIVLPLFHQLTEDDQDRVIATLESVIRDS